LQQEILPEQMVKLLNDGKTDLLPGFVSQRTRRPFKAYLAKGKDGKVGFEFEERKPKGDGSKTKATKTTKAEKESGEEEAVAPTKSVAKKAVVKKTAVKKTTKTAAKKIAVKKAVAKKTA
jgi:DNA topoisomerase-3